MNKKSITQDLYFMGKMTKEKSYNKSDQKEKSYLFLRIEKHLN